MKTRIRIQARVYVNGVLKGKSKWNNLILDNFGSFLAGLISHVGKLSSFTVDVVGDDGLTKTIMVITPEPDTSGSYYFGNVGWEDLGGHMRIGSGTTAPARGDYKIETPFTVAPESDYFDAGTASYSAGTITISGSITAGGSGTINETGFFLKMQDKDDYAVRHMIMLFHDAVSPGVSFSAGDSITVEYSVSL